MPCAQRSFPWPGVSRRRYLTGFLDTSFREGSLTERKRLDAVGTEGGRLTTAKVDDWDVCVDLGFLERDDLASSYEKIMEISSR